MKNGTAVLLEGGRRGRIVRKLRKSISDNPDTFMVMNIGDSFMINGEPSRCTQLLSGSANAFSKRVGHKYKIRSVDGGARCWRVA